MKVLSIALNTFRENLRDNHAAPISPRLLAKPLEALYDKVTIWAAEPAARKAFTPSTTAWPEAIMMTARALAL